MNDIDIDIEEGRRLAAAATGGPWEHIHSDSVLGECILVEHYETQVLAEGANAALIVYLRNNAAAMFDAIETGRQWETRAIAAERSKAALVDKVKRLEDRVTVLYRENVALNAAFRDVADRTAPHHDGGAG